MSIKLNKEEMAQALRDMRESTDNYVQIFAIQAPLIRAKFNALVKEGFSESQAIELCKGQLVQ
jgi:hypothetical protein